MTRFHYTRELGREDAAGWREVAAGALAWFVYSPGDSPAATWLADVPAPWPEDPQELLEHIGAAARHRRVATGAAALWSAHALDVAWAGDVRVVLVRDGQAAAATVDHSLARELTDQGAALGQLPGWDASCLPRITRRCLGDGTGLERARWSPRPGDTLLLCGPQLHDFRPEHLWLPVALDVDTARPGRLLLRTASGQRRRGPNDP